MNERVSVDSAVLEALDAVDEQLVAQLADRARSGGLQPTGEGDCWPG